MGLYVVTACNSCTEQFGVAATPEWIF